MQVKDSRIADLMKVQVLGTVIITNKENYKYYESIGLEPRIVKLLVHNKDYKYKPSSGRYWS